jgi:hypothetical protein
LQNRCKIVSKSFQTKKARGKALDINNQNNLNKSNQSKTIKNNQTKELKMAVQKKLR